MKSLVQSITESSSKYNRNYVLVIAEFDGNPHIDELKDNCKCSFDGRKDWDGYFFIVDKKTAYEFYDKMTFDNVNFYLINSVWNDSSLERLLQLIKKGEIDDIYSGDNFTEILSDQDFKYK